MVVEFKDASYGDASAFIDEWHTWLRAVGCRDPYTNVKRHFSEASETNLLSLKYAYQRGKLVLFLGAGISQELGLPLWGQLLDRMLTNWARQPWQVQTAASLRTASLPEQATWLKNDLEDEYAEALRQALYQDAYRSQPPRTSNVLAVIAEMKELRAVCTYNYDDMLERVAGPPFVPIAQAKDRYEGAEIPVYHVHGLLPYVGSPRGLIVLTEQDYHQLANNHHHWSNTVQLQLLREYTCVFIGLSASDQNLRRLLYTIGQDKAEETYIVQKMRDLGDLAPDSIEAWSAKKEFDRKRFADLDLRTIWVADYDEIPQILRTCLEREPGEWSEAATV